VKPQKPIILLLVLFSAIMLYSYIKVFHGKDDKTQPNAHILYQLDFEESDPFPSFLSKRVATFDDMDSKK
jgi:hypothetical protein